jgi:hypothetical protein
MPSEPPASRQQASLGEEPIIGRRIGIERRGKVFLACDPGLFSRREELRDMVASDDVRAAA